MEYVLIAYFSVALLIYLTQFIRIKRLANKLDNKLLVHVVMISAVLVWPVALIMYFLDTR
jgi:hypothetical protein